MPYDGPQFYDDDAVFRAYSTRRTRKTSPNALIEQPIIQSMIGSPDGLDVLDLGCGDGLFGKTLLDAGAASYCGVDGSKNMVSAAKSNLDGTSAQVIESGINHYDFPAQMVDLVTARLVFHYLPDLAGTLGGISQTLRGGGRLVFSVEHPVITSSNQSLAGGGARQDWIVDDYFVSGARTVSWLGAEVTKFHRTIQDYFLAVANAGFAFESFQESNPNPQMVRDSDEFRRRQRIPLFLMMSVRKP